MEGQEATCSLLCPNELGEGARTEAVTNPFASHCPPTPRGTEGGSQEEGAEGAQATGGQRPPLSLGSNTHLRPVWSCARPGVWEGCHPASSGLCSKLWEQELC